MTFLKVCVGKEIPSNEVNNLILSKNLHFLVEKYFFWELSYFVLKSLTAPIEHHVKLSYINFEVSHPSCVSPISRKYYVPILYIQSNTICV
jgi:hypothetical protein